RPVRAPPRRRPKPPAAAKKSVHDGAASYAFALSNLLNLARIAMDYRCFAALALPGFFVTRPRSLPGFSNEEIADYSDRAQPALERAKLLRETIVASSDD